MILATGSTSVSLDIQIVDDSGLPVTALVAATFPAVSWSLAGPTASTAITLSDLAAITTAYTSGGVKERSNGYYRLDVPNAAFASAGEVKLLGEAMGKHLLCEPIVVSLPKTAATLNATDVTGNLPSDLQTIKTQTVTCAAGVTIGTVVSSLTQTQVTGGAYPLATDGSGNIKISSGTGAGQLSLTSGVVDANAVKMSGTALTGRDIGASVLLSSGTGTGQISLASGTVSATLTAADSPSVHNGTAQAGNAVSITLDSGATATDNLYRGQRVKITGGTGAGQSRHITTYTGATRVALVDHNWIVNPDATSVFAVIDSDGPAVDSSLAIVGVDSVQNPVMATDTNGEPLATATAQTAIKAKTDLIATNAADSPNEVTAQATISTNLNTTVSSRLSSGAFTALTPINFPSLSIDQTTGGVKVFVNNDKTGYSLTVAPPTAAQVASAVWQDTTAGDFTVASSVGKVVFGQLGGAFTAGTSVFTVAALVNAPAGGGGGGTGRTINEVQRIIFEKQS